MATIAGEIATQAICAASSRAVGPAANPGCRSAGECLAAARTRNELISTATAALTARRDAERRKREQAGPSLFPSCAVPVPVIRPGTASEGRPHEPDPSMTSVPPCSFGGVRPLLEGLHRFRVEDLAGGQPRPADGERVTVELNLPLPGGRTLSCRLQLETYKSGFGRPWLGRCPSCGRRVKVLYVHPGGGALACDACTGAVRYTVRVGHRRWYRAVVRHARRAADLCAVAARGRIRAASRRILLAAADRAVGAALAGLACLRVEQGDQARPTNHDRA